MGLINHDVLEAGNGVQKADTYISFTNETLYLRKTGAFVSVPQAPAPAPQAPPAPVDPAQAPSDPAQAPSDPAQAPAPVPAPAPAIEPSQPKQEPVYSVNANYRIFWDKAARDAGKTFMELRSVTAQVPESQLQSNLYAVLYEELKKQFPNSEDK